MAIPTGHLVGHWKLLGDCQDHSGNGNHGINHGVDLDTSTFEGRGQHVEVPASSSIDPQRDDFSYCALIHTDQDVDDVHGDIASKFNPDVRRGFNVSLTSSSGGYSSIGTDRRLAFGIDDAKDGAWIDCGKPSPTSTIINTLSVFDGSLYAANNNVNSAHEASRVFRYAGGDQWEDCGRVGFQRTQGVGPMTTHNGDLYVATLNMNRAPHLYSYDVGPEMWPEMAVGRVYRYLGGKQWEDCGQPGKCPRLTCLASFQGRLYVMGPDDGEEHITRCYVFAGNQKWEPCGEFPHRVFPMAVHDGRLYMAHKAAGAYQDEYGHHTPTTLDEEKGARVFAFDGERWEDLGVPLKTQMRCGEIHCLEVFGGAIHAGTNPLGRVAKLEGGTWRDVGELGDSREVTAFAAYNGSFYAGSLQYADVYRQERGDYWGLSRRFLEESPDPGERIPGTLFPRDRKVDWARVTSLTVYGGELFASTSSCWGDFRGPHGIRGRVYRFRAGQNAAFDRDIGSGWNHVAAVKAGRQLDLYVNGVLVARSTPFDPADYDLSNDRPLRLGSGEVDSFSGRMREVQFYRRALTQQEIKCIHRESLSAL